MRNTVRLLWACLAMALVFSQTSALDARHAMVTGGTWGNLVISRITGNSVSVDRTLSNYQFNYPRFSFDGTRIAAWKKSSAEATFHLSLIDPLSGQVTDLVDITNSGSSPGYGSVICWPAGDWIYYHRPEDGLQDKGTGEIWRVNSTDPSKRELVVDYTKVNLSQATWNDPDARKVNHWHLSADGRVSEINLLGASANVDAQVICRFPPVGGDAKSADNYIFTLPNCNPCISATAAFAGRFTDGGHTDMTLYRWDESANRYQTMTGLPYRDGSAISNDNLESWSGSSDWASGEMHWPDWAVNSDRWMVLQVRKDGGGASSVVFSWMDKTCIIISDNNPNHVASLFVEGGQTGRVQDVDGNWSTLQPAEIMPYVEWTGANPYQVTLRSKPAGAEFYYTIDGSEPTQSSTRYDGPFSLTVPSDRYVWVKAKAFSGQSVSNVVYRRFAPVALVGTGLTCQLWKNVPGNAVADLTSDPRYPDNPDETWIARSMSYQYGDWYTQYGRWDGAVPVWGIRLCGYVIPPLTGTYRFTMVAQNSGSLRLGTSSDPSTAREIAAGVWPTWQNTPAVSSGDIPLQAGTWYYIEAIQKKGTIEGITFNVGWSLPDGSREGSIQALRLMPLDSDPTRLARHPVAGNRKVSVQTKAHALVYDALGNVIEGVSRPPSGAHPAPGVYFVGTPGAVRRVVVRADGVSAALPR